MNVFSDCRYLGDRSLPSKLILSHIMQAQLTIKSFLFYSFLS